MRATLFFRFIILHMILFTFLRLIFFLSFKNSESYILADIRKAFFLGLRFDLRLVLLMLLPLLMGILWFSPLKSRFAKKIWRFFYSIVGATVFVFYIFDFGFYGYLNSRINSAILTFLENPDISFAMMWETYPVIWVAIGFIAIVSVYSFLLKRFVFLPLPSTFLHLPRWFLSFAFVFVFFAGLYGSVSQYPLRWSEAFFSHHHYLSHLSLNPVLYFAETYSFSTQSGFNIEKIKKNYPLMKSYLGSEGTRDDQYLLSRKVKAQGRKKPLNVVVIIMESLAMSKTSLSNNPLNPTPYLQQIAQEGLLFNNYYSPCEGTARNIFSIMTGIPDVTKVETSTRNPLVVDQKLIANSYKNYRKMYFLGGSASWANIRGIFSHNIEGVEIFEEGAFDKTKTDVWGVSDLDLFIEADRVLSQNSLQKPFFAVIQSASFHRPYTIPLNALQFKKQSEPYEKLKEAGFYSQEQWDSLRFSDYSLGHFFALAKKKPYYKNTLFVITGDHGLPDEGGVNVPEGSHIWGLERYHVPLLLVNKQVIPQAGRDERLAGHVDLMTTAADLAGVEHTNTTLGRSLFNKDFDRERYAFLYNYYSEIGEFGLVSSRYYYRYDNLKQGQLYDLSAKNPALDIKDKAQDVFERMDELAKAHMEYARYLLLNNGKDKQD